VADCESKHLPEDNAQRVRLGGGFVGDGFYDAVESGDRGLGERDFSNPVLSVPKVDTVVGHNPLAGAVAASDFLKPDVEQGVDRGVGGNLATAFSPLSLCEPISQSL